MDSLIFVRRRPLYQPAGRQRPARACWTANSGDRTSQVLLEHESRPALLDSLNVTTARAYSSPRGITPKKIGDNIVSVTDSYRVIASVRPDVRADALTIRDGRLVGGYVYDDAR